MSKKDEALKLAQEYRPGMPIEVLHAWAEQMQAAIREALAEQPAQQQEPVALPEKIYEFVPTPEPTKWHHPECEGECIACLIEQVVQEAYGSQGLGYLQRHLTSPPASKPLTDEQITAGARALCQQMAEACNVDAGDQWQLYADTFKEDAKAVLEAAHGIKEKNT